MSRAHDIEIIEGLEAVRPRPNLYIGEAILRRLLECIVDSIVGDTSAPNAVRLLLWQDDAFTVAFDGAPLPIQSCAISTDDVPHPELYRFFMAVGAHSPGRRPAFAILNALTERLTVSTLHDGVRYRAAFCRGALVSLLTKAPTDQVLGSSWLTFKADAEVIRGTIRLEDVEQLAARVASPGVHLSIIDKRTEKPDWS